MLREEMRSKCREWIGGGGRAGGREGGRVREMKHREEGMVQQNSHSQQLLVQEIRMQGSSGAETDQNSSFSPFYLLKNSPAFISRHTSYNVNVSKRN